jgi:hypothetical protein
MSRIRLALLRGVCQTPAYIAYDLGYFQEEGVEVAVEIQPTAWVVPERLARQEVQFAVIPWTRVAAASSHGEDLVLVCGSGCEEAALVVRAGMEPHEVQRIAVPQEGGIKDLTAMALLQSLGWNERATERFFRSLATGPTPHRWSNRMRPCWKRSVLGESCGARATSGPALRVAAWPRRRSCSTTILSWFGRW